MLPLTNLCKKSVTKELTVTEICFLWCDTAFFPLVFASGTLIHIEELSNFALAYC